MSIFVLFGRPGSGKTTIASSKSLAIYLEQNNQMTIDLDVLIPQAMKDNFALDIYPSIDERKDFTRLACDHIDECIRNSQCHSCLVSFSFVNTDMREIFRSRFPTSKWILVDTTPEEAEKRILQRQGHFYKNTTLDRHSERRLEIEGEVSNESTTKIATQTVKGPEWDFADVDFDHIQLNGLDEIDENVCKLITIIHQ